jgi:hypothetical protein
VLTELDALLLDMLALNVAAHWLRRRDGLNALAGTGRDAECAKDDQQENAYDVLFQLHLNDVLMVSPTNRPVLVREYLKLTSMWI